MAVGNDRTTGQRLRDNPDLFELILTGAFGLLVTFFLILAVIDYLRGL